jgi:hypothetical protein
VQLFAVKWVPISIEVEVSEVILKVSPLFQKRNQGALVTKALFITVILACAAAVAAIAQSSMSPYQGEGDGVSAGGGWMVFHSEDKMTGAKKARFELLSNNYFREDAEYKPRVELVCTNGKYEYADFNPGVRLALPDHPGFWWQPQMEVRVRIDDFHDHKGWNWVRGRFLSMDKGTIRGMLQSQVFNLEVRTRSGPQIAEFSPAGLDLGQVKQACDLKPEKP